MAGFYDGLKLRRPLDTDTLPRLLALTSEDRVMQLAAALGDYLEVFLPEAISKRKTLEDYRTNPYVSMTTASTMKLTDPRELANFIVNLKLYMGLETSFGKSIESVVMGFYPATPECHEVVRRWESPEEKEAEFAALDAQRLTRVDRARARNASVWREIDRSAVVGDRRYLVSIKSGPATINDTQVSAMKDAIRDNHETWLESSIARYGVVGLDVVIGLTYGTNASTNNKELQILAKLLDSGFEAVAGSPGVIANPDGTVRVYRVVGTDYWAFAGCPNAPERTPAVFLEVLLALAKALKRDAESTLEDLLNERLELLGEAIRTLRFPRESLPQWVREEFSAEELTWLAAAMSTFFDSVKVDGDADLSLDLSTDPEGEAL